ncbi:unnamed protein product, partial [Allacma fusca]
AASTSPSTGGPITLAINASGGGDWSYKELQPTLSLHTLPD